jgi:hypothetical protein
VTAAPIEGRIPVLARGHHDPRVARGIRRIRTERGWSLDDVALLLGCDRSRVSRIESGQRGTPVPSLVADALGVPVEHLLAACPRCDGKPPYGYQCMRCGAETPA